jgi:diaminohydroxyphosphoribosylaminopyrimidine deaminase/5-amino-6-(5-phosphoribosylamino)uracil reductase
MDDEAYMAQAVDLGRQVKGTTAPNPWVGSVVVPAGSGPSDRVFTGATAPPGGPHAEIVALDAAAGASAGATLYTTLEPCAHHGRTPPCVDAIAAAGVARVVIGTVDPDPQVAGAGIAALEAAGVAVTTGVLAETVASELAPYLKQRRTGRPWVVLKLASTLDGRTAAPDGSSRWITGAAARDDVHRLRAESDAVLVGAGTVRADDPELTARTVPPLDPAHQPLRVVLGAVPSGSRVEPALSLTGPLPEVLSTLGGRGVLQLLVEGGPRVAHDFHTAGLVDRYVFYLAPALFGGDDGRPVFSGPGAARLDEVWRGAVVSVSQLGDDVKVELAPSGHEASATGHRPGVGGEEAA